MVRSLFILSAVVAILSLSSCADDPVRYHAGEVQTGLATWYGSDADGGDTASGETFHMHDLTAAHRHLPFGSVVRVTNRRNGNSVEVRINDRGPFDDADRIIDVSDAAAEILDMKGAGVVPVEVEVLSVGSGRRHHED